MSSGETGVFRFALQSGRYVIERQAGPEYVADEDAAIAGDREGSEAEGVIECTERTLPERVTFASGETAYDARAEGLASDTQDLPNSDYGLSDPILFYPDGTTSTAVVVLANEYDRTIEISLRGLTGVATVGKVQSGGENLP